MQTLQVVNQFAITSKFKPILRCKDTLFPTNNHHFSALFPTNIIYTNAFFQALVSFTLCETPENILLTCTCSSSPKLQGFGNISAPKKENRGRFSKNLFKLLSDLRKITIFVACFSVMLKCEQISKESPHFYLLNRFTNCNLDKDERAIFNSHWSSRIAWISS